MNAIKPIAIVAATLITAAGMAGIVSYSNVAAHSSRAAIESSAPTSITTLPTIEVRPTREQLRELRDGTGATSSSRSRAYLEVTMPFYSYASDAAGA
ncbi:MAG: hypothetical protein ACREPL_11185 [Rhodanobacteraceae bacterium]